MAGRRREPGRWVRLPESLRDELASLADDGSTPVISEVVALWDRARSEDWIAQLVEINRELVAENRRLAEQRRTATRPLPKLA